MLVAPQALWVSLATPSLPMLWLLRFFPLVEIDLLCGLNSFDPRDCAASELDSVTHDTSTSLHLCSHSGEVKVTRAFYENFGGDQVSVRAM